MDVVEALSRMGGFSDAATLIALTSRQRVRTAVTKGLIVRDERGRYALPTADLALREANRLTAIVSHASAATVWGWELKHQPERPILTVPRNRTVAAHRRRHVEVHYATLADHEIVRGVATSALRTVMDCAKVMPFDEALAVADSALRHGEVTRNDLITEARQQQPRHRRRCLRVAMAADSRAANPFESVLRAIALSVEGLEVEPQLVIRHEGRFVARSDLGDRRRRLAIEAESYAFHSSRASLTHDCERYNKLAEIGWIVLRFTWEHVMFDPDYVRSVLASFVDQPVERAVGDGLVQLPA